MALFIIKPAIVQKNVPTNFQIDYADLASYAAVPGGHFKDINNWKKVIVQVKHKFSGQKGTITFEKPGDTASLHLNDTARGGGWEMEKVLIEDYDRGQVLLSKSDIPSVANYDFIAQSSATHGDLWVGPSQVVTIPSGGKRQYGDFVVETGGILKLADGGGITEIEALDNCIINGTIEANNGTHTGGAWNSTSVLSESLNLTITQKAGGNGGAGEAGATVIQDIGNSGGTAWILDFATVLYRSPINSSPVDLVNIGDTIELYTDSGFTNLVGVKTVTAVYPDGAGYNAGYSSIYITEGVPNGNYHFKVKRSVASPGGAGGSTVSGNGAGGGRSSKFGALAGGNGSLGLAGLGAGQNDLAADEYGEDGAPSLTASEAGNGGFRGKHGQALYIKAKRIQGTGTINAAGQKGGDGGDGAEYLDGGILYGNGAGGGAAGGDGGKIWLRYISGTPSLSLLISGGAKGNRGFGGFGSTEAQHGIAGSGGSTDIATW